MKMPNNTNNLDILWTMNSINFMIRQSDLCNFVELATGKDNFSFKL